MLRAARELLAVRSPLDAELMVSELLGTWWGQQPGRAGMRSARRRRADIEELIGEGLVAYAAEQGSPAALHFEVVQGAHAHPAVGETGCLALHFFDDRHRRTSSVVPAIRTPWARSPAVAGSG